jgi:hypothetical protein
MAHRTYPVGTPLVTLSVAVNSAGPVTGLAVTARVLDPINATEFDFSTNTFVPNGTAVTPTIPLTESPVQIGVYFGPMVTAGIVAEVQTVVVYQAVAVFPFISEDMLDFYEPRLDFLTAFVEAVFDKTNNTLTVLGGVKNGQSVLQITTAGVITITDELETVLFSKATTSATGIHRAVFPNVSITPNRALLVKASFTIGALTINTINTLAIIGKDA